MNLARRVAVVAVSALLAVGIAAPGSARPRTTAAGPTPSTAQPTTGAAQPTTGAAQPKTGTAQPQTTAAVTSSVDYGPAELTAYYDPARKAAPWIGLVHGGSWYTGSRWTYAALAQQWRQAGFQVFTIDYRLAPAAIWPAQRDDVAAAVRYIQSHAATYHLDAANGVLLGHSAGGQIVADAVDTGAVHVRAVVDLAGVVSPYLAWLDGHAAGATSGTAATQLADYATLMMGCPPARNRPACWARWIDASAIAHVSAHNPPTLIIASQYDPIVPVRMSTYYAQRLAAVGAKYTLRIVYGATAHDVLGLPGVANEVLGWIRSQTAGAI